MKIKHQELFISKDKPFENCQLDREKYASVLTDIVESYSEGFVLSINNAWGTGKTTFIKMWKQHLENQGFQTIYFNAWENDFDSNPLVAIMSELKTLINGDKDRENKFKSALEKAAILAKNITPALVNALSKKYIGETGADLLENTTKAAVEIFESEINIYTNKKETINEFKNELEKFIKTKSDQKPLVFIIDELDRCRPDYAVELLEKIKHFFSIPGIIFVLSIDKVHLSSSVKGFYGSDQINADEYLRRFIDLEYSIPSPSKEGSKKFVRYLYEYYSFKTFFSSEKRKKIDELKDDDKDFLSMAESLFEKSNITLRQQEQIFARATVTISSCQNNSYLIPGPLFFLIYLKVTKNDLFKKIEDNKLSLQELSDDFKLCFDSTDGNSRIINYFAAQLLLLYDNNKPYKQRIPRNINSMASKNFIIADSAIREILIELIDSTQIKWTGLELRVLMDKINLLEQIQLKE